MIKMEYKWVGPTTEAGCVREGCCAGSRYSWHRSGPRAKNLPVLPQAGVYPSLDAVW